MAYTKTFILVVDAILVITLAPVLISLFMKGRFRPESANPINRVLERIYEPVIRVCIKWRKTTIGLNILALLVSIPLLLSLGREFMPPLDEGSLLFMPVTLPDVSNSEVKRLLQVQDKIIKTVPEVDNVLGKAGRAGTATDNSPISMIETIVLLKPKAQWRAGVTKDSLIRELNEKLQIPGVTNGWTQPIINRINMLATATDRFTPQKYTIKAPPIKAKGMEIKLKNASRAEWNAKYMARKMISSTTGRTSFRVRSLRIRFSYCPLHSI